MYTKKGKYLTTVLTQFSGCYYSRYFFRQVIYSEYDLNVPNFIQCRFDYISQGFTDTVALNENDQISRLADVQGVVLQQGSLL